MRPDQEFAYRPEPPSLEEINPVTHERPDTDALVRERLRANADDVDALFVLAALRLRDGDVGGGLSVLERVLRIDPRYPGAWIFKAKLHGLLGDREAAESARQSAEAHEP